MKKIGTILLVSMLAIFVGFQIMKSTESWKVNHNYREAFRSVYYEQEIYHALAFTGDILNSISNDSLVKSTKNLAELKKDLEESWKTFVSNPKAHINNYQYVTDDLFGNINLTLARYHLEIIERMLDELIQRGKEMDEIIEKHTKEI